MPYTADRSLLIETMNKWRSSPVYRDEDSRLQMEGEISAAHEWLGEAEEIALPAPIVTRWGSEADIYEGSAFEDVAKNISVEDLAEIVQYLDPADGLVEAVLDLVQDGAILYMSRPGDTQGFAVGLSEGSLFAAEIELEETLIDEGLISMHHLQVNTGDQWAPTIPGFAPIEGRLFEAAHAAEVLRSTLIEMEIDEAHDLVDLIEEYIHDVVESIADLASDETITEKEALFISDTFEGVYGGIAEAAREFFLS